MTSVVGPGRPVTNVLIIAVYQALTVENGYSICGTSPGRRGTRMPTKNTLSLVQFSNIAEGAGSSGRKFG